MIEGVIITPLKQIADERGKVMHMLRADAPHFQGFGEVYFSSINPGVVKGWKRHRRMVLNLATVSGTTRLVIFDDRPDSPTRGEVAEIALGKDNYALVTVPPMVWTAFAAAGSEPALMANCASIPHEPDEADSRSLDDPAIPYDWTSA